MNDKICFIKKIKKKLKIKYHPFNPLIYRVLGFWVRFLYRWDLDLIGFQVGKLHYGETLNLMWGVV